MVIGVAFRAHPLDYARPYAHGACHPQHGSVGLLFVSCAMLVCVVRGVLAQMGAAHFIYDIVRKLLHLVSFVWASSVMHYAAFVTSGEQWESAIMSIAFFPQGLPSTSTRP